MLLIKVNRTSKTHCAYSQHNKSMPTEQPGWQAPQVFDDIQLHDWQDDVHRQYAHPHADSDVVDNMLSPTSAGESSSSSRPSNLSRMQSSESFKSTVSTKSIRESMIDEIKHEVMVNFLFQKQCSSLWIGDGAGELEGVMLRKSKGVYLSCPPQLIDTTFGHVCIALNVQVCSGNTWIY